MINFIVIAIFLGYVNNFRAESENKGATKEVLSSLLESFENGAPRWRGINKSGTDPDDTVQIYSATNAYDGNFVIRFGSLSTYDASEWLITPPLRVTSSADTFVFYYKASHYYGGEVFELRIADSIPTGGAYDTTYFKIAYQPDTANDTVWHRYRQPLGSYAGKNIQIAIHYMSDYKWYLYVDYFLSSALVDTIPPSIRLVYPHSHFRKPGQTRDTVKFVIKDTSGVRRSAIQDWGYKHPGDTSWTDMGYMDLLRNGDTFYNVMLLRFQTQ